MARDIFTEFEDMWHGKDVRLRVEDIDDGDAQIMFISDAYTGITLKRADVFKLALILLGIAALPDGDLFEREGLETKIRLLVQ